MELSAIMLQLEVREKELMKYVNKVFITVVIRLLYGHAASFLHHQALLVVSLLLFVFKGISCFEIF